MTTPTVVQAEGGREDHTEDQKRRTVRQVKQQEQKEKRDSNGNVIKEDTEERKKSVPARLWSLILRVLSKKPNFYPNGRRASYNFEDSLSQKEQPTKRRWWWPKQNVKGRQRRLSAVIAQNDESPKEDLPVRYRSTDCL
ncbi:hypothetical protein OESDEN_16734 [Oesophagostomum dentatum]|uniref:Uncharacterized protein n=1 Tax=Oesophagostomum dentatum TaxID=61180 RepID=A0A0B1SI48_OESDE|nr:hypothetical protein OESDEN_16734 [Oesophagostomum dentatum]